MSDILEISRVGRVLRVALNRPGKRNALNAELGAAIVDHLGWRGNLVD
jgi:enoyl-CoA hydratase/carnithine racemase